LIYRSFGKRSLDVIASTILLLIACVPIFSGFVVVRITSEGPGYFRQTRVGLGGHTFVALKLRTMSVRQDRPLAQTTLQDPDVLPAGRWMRRLKIDELPQLWNVFKGDMSLIGPRPCLEETRDEMPSWARRRFEVRPGLTGLAQVSGNVALTWEERWRHDVKYVDQLSFLVDLKILMKTVLVVLLGEEKFKRSA
jgi:undecaprenyl phosphate N,N'-diacetylbacillosamine 1-phosphate transferase